MELLAGLIGASSAVAATPAADCQPYAEQPCLLPFPNNLMTRVDRTSATGLRVHLPAAAMPVNKKGSRIAVGEYDRADGFSPGSAIIVHVGGLDLTKTGAVGLPDMSKAFVRKAPIVVIDEQTGARQLIWAEMDANAQGDQNINLLIHPGQEPPRGPHVRRRAAQPAQRRRPADQGAEMVRACCGTPGACRSPSVIS